LTKKFTRSIIVLLFLNLLVKPFWVFGIDRTIQNRVGAEEYGLYFSLFGFSLLLNMISDLGITNYNNRNIAQNQDQLGIQLGLIIPVKLLLSILYCIVTISIAFCLGYSSRHFSLLIWLIVNQMLSSFILYLRSNISAMQMFITDSIISVLDKLLTILVCGIMLWGQQDLTFRIEWLVLSQTIAYSVTLLFVLPIVLKKSGKIHLGFNFKNAIKILKKSFPYALLAMLMMSYSRIDAVMIERMIPNGKTEAGIYAQAFRISDALSMFAILFASILLPLFAKMLKEHEPIGATLSHSFALLMIPVISIIAVLLNSSHEFMNLLYQQHGEESANILSLLLFGFGGICLNYIFGTLLTSAGQLSTLNKISALGLILNIILNLLMIPSYGAMGAAIANATTQLMIGISQAFISIRIMKIKVKIFTLIKYGFLAVMTIAMAFLSKLIMPWYIMIFLIPGLAIFMGIAMKLIKIENLKISLN
jgi:O-antigen/teichoic acid export membrane protein